VLLFVASVLTWRLPREQLFPLLSALVWAHVIAACLFLPKRMGVGLLAMAVGVVAFLAGANSLKIGLTGLPLTMLDLRIALANPAGLWDSLNLPRWTLPLTLLGLALAAVFVLATGVRALRSRWRSQPWHGTARLAAVRLGCLLAVAVIADANMHRMFGHLSGYRGTWEPEGLVAMAAEIGVVPFLAYSRHVEHRNTGDFFRSDPSARPPPDADVDAAALRYIDFAPRPVAGPRPAPNIVVLMAESTFDPNRAFRLTASVGSGLFTADAYTAAVGPLRVNVIGGGTWVTEFESIVGLDSRLFGYAGYYTHSSLSPYVQRTLATDLEQRGYHTLALLPHEGEFYNYRNAYNAYGFDRVIDSRDLGLQEGWLPPTSPSRSRSHACSAPGRHRRSWPTSRWSRITGRTNAT